MIWSAAALAAAALLALSARWMVETYGRARFEAGVATGRAEGLAKAGEKNTAAMQAAIAAERRIAQAERLRGNHMARISAEAARAENEVRDYEQSIAGHGACLDAERVRHIEDSRALLLPDDGLHDPGESGP